MFAIFDGNNVKVKELKTYDSCVKWLKKHPELNSGPAGCSIGELGEAYWADRIVRSWKFNQYSLKFQRADPVTGDWLHANQL